MAAYTELAQISCAYFPAGFEFEQNKKLCVQIHDSEMDYPDWESATEKLPNGNFKAVVPVYSFEVNCTDYGEGESCLDIEEQGLGKYDFYQKFFKQWAVEIDKIFAKKACDPDQFRYAQFVAVFKISYAESWYEDFEGESKIEYLGVLDMNKLEIIK